MQGVFLLGTKDVILEAVVCLRNTTITDFEESEDLRWLPTAKSLDTTNSILPDELKKVLKLVVSGKVEDTSVQVNRVVNSIGQDICRAVTYITLHDCMPSIS